MKKRLISLGLVATMTASLLAGCGSSDKDGGSSAKGNEIALVTDVGTIDDKSFNQGSWEGVVKYAEEKGISHKYYKPSEKSDAAILSSINLAIKGGAKVVVCPGFLFEVPVHTAQKENPDVKFIIVDGAPHAAAQGSPTDIADNTQSIFFAEEQAGYLAGYAAVVEGYRSLGFMGGIAIPSVARFGYGYVQGADQAAKDLGLKEGEVTIKYTYVGNFEATPENQTLAASWYNEGVEVIFGCGGGVGNSVMKAAETAGKKVIGVDVDQSVESDTVITSAMKNLGKSVYDALDGFYSDSFKGGQSVTFDAKDGGVQLPMDTSKFEKFTKEKYDELYAKLADGSIKVENNEVAESADKVPTDIVKVEVK